MNVCKHWKLSAICEIDSKYRKLSANILTCWNCQFQHSKLSKSLGDIYDSVYRTPHRSPFTVQRTTHSDLKWCLWKKNILMRQKHIYVCRLYLIYKNNYNIFQINILKKDKITISRIVGFISLNECKSSVMFHCTLHT